MALKEIIAPELEPVAIMALMGICAGIVWLACWAAEKYGNIIGKRQEEHDRKEREKAEERKRQGVIGMYGVDE
jgi:hypothetical protein